MRQGYEDRVLRVLAYMHANPAGDLSLDRLAEVAALSRFHWHRVFHAMTGETCAQAVRRIRLFRAACWLVQTDWPIAEVACRCGYPGVPSFSRAFRDSFGVPPGQFRQAGMMRRPPLPVRKGDIPMYEVTIETHPTRRLAAIGHTGPYVEIGQAFETLSVLCTSRNLWPQVQGMLGIYYDDPAAVEPSALRSHAAVIVGQEVQIEDPLEALTLEGGKVGMLLYKGPYSGLKAAYDYIYAEWLPGSDEEPRDTPCYEIYLNGPQDTAPEDLLTQICVPLR